MFFSLHTLIIQGREEETLTPRALRTCGWTYLSRTLSWGRKPVQIGTYTTSFWPAKLCMNETHHASQSLCVCWLFIVEHEVSSIFSVNQIATRLLLSVQRTAPESASDVPRGRTKFSSYTEYSATERVEHINTISFTRRDSLNS